MEIPLEALRRVIYFTHTYARAKHNIVISSLSGNMSFGNDLKMVYAPDVKCASDGSPNTSVTVCVILLF